MNRPDARSDATNVAKSTDDARTPSPKGRRTRVRGSKRDKQRLSELEDKGHR